MHYGRYESDSFRKMMSESERHKQFREFIKSKSKGKSHKKLYNI